MLVCTVSQAEVLVGMSVVVVVVVIATCPVSGWYRANDELVFNKSSSFDAGRLYGWLYVPLFNG